MEGRAEASKEGGRGLKAEALRSSALVDKQHHVDKCLPVQVHRIIRDRRDAEWGTDPEVYKHAMINTDEANWVLDEAFYIRDAVVQVSCIYYLGNRFIFWVIDLEKSLLSTSTKCYG